MIHDNYFPTIDLHFFQNKLEESDLKMSKVLKEHANYFDQCVLPKNVVKEHGNQLKLGQKTKIVFVKYIKIYKSNSKNCEQTILSVFQGLFWYVFYIISLN